MKEKSLWPWHSMIRGEKEKFPEEIIIELQFVANLEKTKK